MADRELNLPDLLGYIAGNAKAPYDLVHVALGVNPQQTPAGQNFEALLLVQSAFDCDVDVRVRLLFPANDVKGEKGRFFTKVDRILVGLQPAEAGVVKLPMACSPLTAQAIDYKLGVELSAERKARRAQRVRDHEGGVLFAPDDLTSAELLKRIEELKQITFTAVQDRRKRLIASFDVIAPTGPSLGLNLAPGWESLWTMSDYVDEQVVIEKAGALANQLLPTLKRNRVFMPLMKAAQTRFTAAGYPLQPGEALFVAKLLTLVLESGVSVNPDAPTPRWYVRLCRELFADERAASNPDRLVTEVLWRDLIMDATVLGFNMVGTVTRQQLGSDDEIEAYALDLANRLSAEKPSLDFMRTYLPLVMGGIVANTRIVLDREQVLDSVHMVDQARKQRQAEMTEANQDVFNMTDMLINRALDMF